MNKKTARAKQKRTRNNGSVKKSDKSSEPALVTEEKDIENENKSSQRSKPVNVELTWYKGHCKWFNSVKGWGFLNIDKDDTEASIKDYEPSGDIFVYQSSIMKEGFRSLGLGEEVQFQAKRTDKGWEAVTVKGLEGLPIQGTDKLSVRRMKKKRCFNCGNITRHLAADCPHPPLPKRCHHCKVELELDLFSYSTYVFSPMHI